MDVEYNGVATEFEAEFERYLKNTLFTELAVIMRKSKATR